MLVTPARYRLRSEVGNPPFFNHFLCQNGYGSKTALDHPALQRGDYVKGHDPEVSKAPIGRSCFHDLTSYVYMSLWLGQRSCGKVERSVPVRTAIVFTLRVQLIVSTLGTVDMTSKVNFMDCEPTAWRKERNQTITSLNRELVVVWIGAWLWCGSGLDRPRSGPTFCACCSLDAVRQEKDDKVCRQQVDSLAAWQPQCQLGSLTAWTRNSSSLAAGLLSSVALRQVSLEAWQRGFTTVCCLAVGRVENWSINSQIHDIIPKVWINGLDQLPWKGLDRGSGPKVWIICGTGAWSRPYMLSRNHMPASMGSRTEKHILFCMLWNVKCIKAILIRQMLKAVTDHLVLHAFIPVIQKLGI